MTDRELLEAAAKAAGIAWQSYHMQKGLCLADVPGGMCITQYWNPLDSDADALRLAVKLGVIIDVRYTKPEIREHNCVNYWLPHEEHRSWNSISFDEHSDPYAATRRAIVRAAAEIGAAEPQMDAQARADWSPR